LLGLELAIMNEPMGQGPFLMAEGERFAARPSGTEGIYKIYAENLVRVELYANGINGNSPIRLEMTRVQPPVGETRGGISCASVPAIRPPADYTARIIPQCAGVAVPLEIDPILWQR